ncbi:helix-turn-helix domain-containing protein [Photobacterium lucens]|uniref:helix-turn-helix domain-containing protein n=1 Tax=Photobacterium lucens TaxID=2562949 RepID=UPI000D1701A4|nr:helix-turn-helix domain-containing protein [Photobacterium lucens]MBP2701081.1 helix-turn-helix domain-containing protein [Vibrio parahaemolyticus]MZG57361.1 helix-turn-helix domain-containing protein [Photobacterium lucens]MZG81111.1 helix-turn-helix domain-containing protein [Photobacterium lucens]PSV21988.1 transcriptional regulator [Photobacterium leiognathi subsp. mandapamensis]
MQITSAKMLANAVRDQRKAQSRTQSDTAKLVGIKQTTVSAFENNPESTKLETLFKLLAALDLELHVQPRNTNTEPHTAQQKWNEEW